MKYLDLQAALWSSPLLLKTKQHPPTSLVSFCIFSIWSPIHDTQKTREQEWIDSYVHFFWISWRKWTLM
jgi:hypothetical protein